ncbi:hypothetical protein BDFB_006917 [Asbolus verrucosus]|uniref:Uncharacterized protein n=1 Tax=Asbolus verrucosus TaxID=1661398 RepID=A0A482V8R2_ASBVE|nr:hypothetical protein BDFB_006917 [Asbolus verrucosus]
METKLEEKFPWNTNCKLNFPRLMEGVKHSEAARIRSGVASYIKAATRLRYRRKYHYIQME